MSREKPGEEERRREKKRREKKEDRRREKKREGLTKSYNRARVSRQRVVIDPSMVLGMRLHSILILRMLSSSSTPHFDDLVRRP